MHILKIRAEWFRNYNCLEFEPHRNLNIITGLNAQGKTNLLEAIFFNLSGRSFRTNNLKEVISWQSDYCSVANVVAMENRQWKQSVAVNKAGNKKIFINGVEKKKKDLRHSGVILFTPDDLALIKNSPAERRKFLDQEIGSFYPAHARSIQQYAKVLSHRNRLLKNARNKSNLDTAMLEIWDQQLVTSGTSVLLGRLLILKKLAPLAIKWYNLMTGGKENLEIRYMSSLKIEIPVDNKKLKERFYQVLKEVRGEEIKRCQTLAGPHRDDVIFFINGKDARIFGSQGQQRTVVLSLKLAQVTLWTREYQSKPVLLLDDVLFELDKTRQEMLLTKAREGIQTFVTTSQFNSHDLNQQYRLFTVENGRLISSY
ncbi:DNA replication and repair protein RecF [Desulfohalotomaculum tongense]|uniref:DNA replication/repair protein RecF n=1 Tax=Desulforadius tongensis TaxID=1216062 RepID=UPI00195DE67A|nr:DNA replication/repair protein RecF [Desulforadius tongensis]MBM7855833.1 DNA replication and repair protein RecF [Desulforadius tongensis]